MLLANLARLRAVPIPKDLDALVEFVLPLPENIAYTLVRDYDKLIIPSSTGPVRYSKIFDHLWSYIRSHPHKEELVKRLTEEIIEGVGVCPNGKLARLMNVVEGYMEGVSTANPKELFQNRMAVIAAMEKTDRLKEATKAFQEFGIPEGERGPWLEALE
jgi:predicted house-cleaning noncanonical NTP pyrophosphatase (MazG superfamily)